mgnify:CR=1 FL=1
MLWAICVDSSIGDLQDILPTALILRDRIFDLLLLLRRIGGRTRSVPRRAKSPRQIDGKKD